MKRCCNYFLSLLVLVILLLNSLVGYCNNVQSYFGFLTNVDISNATFHGTIIGLPTNGSGGISNADPNIFKTNGANVFTGTTNLVVVTNAPLVTNLPITWNGSNWIQTSNLVINLTGPINGSNITYGIPSLGWYNATNFGIVFDGVTDNTSNINVMNAYVEQQGGGNIWWPNETNLCIVNGQIYLPTNRANFRAYPIKWWAIPTSYNGNGGLTYGTAIDYEPTNTKYTFDQAYCSSGLFESHGLTYLANRTSTNRQPVFFCGGQSVWEWNTFIGNPTNYVNWFMFGNPHSGFVTNIYGTNNVGINGTTNEPSQGYPTVFNNNSFWASGSWFTIGTYVSAFEAKNNVDAGLNYGPAYIYVISDQTNSGITGNVLIENNSFQPQFQSWLCYITNCIGLSWVNNQASDIAGSYLGQVFLDSSVTQYSIYGNSSNPNIFSYVGGPGAVNNTGNYNNATIASIYSISNNVYLINGATIGYNNATFPYIKIASVPNITSGWELQDPGGELDLFQFGQNSFLSIQAPIQMTTNVFIKGTNSALVLVSSNSIILNGSNVYWLSPGSGVTFTTNGTTNLVIASSGVAGAQTPLTNSVNASNFGITNLGQLNWTNPSGLPGNNISNATTNLNMTSPYGFIHLNGAAGIIADTGSSGGFQLTSNGNFYTGGTNFMFGATVTNQFNFGGGANYLSQGLINFPNQTIRGGYYADAPDGTYLAMGQGSQVNNQFVNNSDSTSIDFVNIQGVTGQSGDILSISTNTIGVATIGTKVFRFNGNSLTITGGYISGTNNSSGSNNSTNHIAFNITATNFVVNTFYTNITGFPQIVGMTESQTLAASVGNTGIQLYIIGTNGTTNGALTTTTALSIAMTQGQQLQGFVPNMDGFIFTNLSTVGSAALVSGSGSLLQY